MDPNSTNLILAAGGRKVNILPLTAPLLFPMSINSSGAVFIHGVRTNGTVVGSYQLPSAVPYHGFFYNPFLIIYSAYGSQAYIINCNDMTLAGTISGIPPSGFYPWSDGKYISVNSWQDQIHILDVIARNISVYSYAADDGYSQIAQNHMTVGFANNGPTLFSSLQNRYWWSAGTSDGSGSNFPVYYYRADRASETSLGPRSLGFGPGNNYSRTWGLSFNSSAAMYCNIGGNFFVVGSTSNTPIGMTLGTVSVGGTSYNAYLDSTDVQVRCTSSTGNLYLMNFGTVSTYDYRYRIVNYQNYAIGSQSGVDCGIDLRSKSTSSGGPYYFPQDGTFMCQINQGGMVAIAYFDVANYGANTNQLIIKIINGSSVVSTVNTSISTAYTGGSSSSFNEVGLNGCSWTTNLLYTGSAYN